VWEEKERDRVTTNHPSLKQVPTIFIPNLCRRLIEGERVYTARGIEEKTIKREKQKEGTRERPTSTIAPSGFIGNGKPSAYLVFAKETRHLRGKRYKKKEAGGQEKRGKGRETVKHKGLSALRVRYREIQKKKGKRKPPGGNRGHEQW